MASSPKRGGIADRLDHLYEFEREPVAGDQLQPGRHFAGLFAGEHVGATEFVIGALFISWGASAFDLLAGLLLGNLLAVLSWTLVCAAISVQTRLTLYWYLRRIAGPGVTVAYNVLNALLYCILAGAMITVSASAVRIPFGIPAQTHWYPDDFRFVILVLIIGALVVTLAVLGFRRLAQFSSLCSPWMFLIFIAGALATLPGLAASAPDIGAIHGLSDLWRLADKVIWPGIPSRGASQLSFWHMAAFAWICNLAMHIGLSDMAIFRYARNYRYGLYSAFGMFLGHYLAWICAGIMGAAAAAHLKQPLSELDSGAVAYHAAGVSGAIAVVLAGWTTANPTLYRAGLALQVITPGWPRWLVTLLAGAATTLMACSPFVVTGLLDFVGLYGILLMPIGAIVVVEHWIFPRLGWTRFWSTRKGLTLNIPALTAWLAAIAASSFLWLSGSLHLFFLAAPVWLLTAVVYLTLSAMMGARDPMPQDGQTPAVKPGNGRPASVTTSIPRFSGARKKSLLLWISGGAALTFLIACLALPAWVLMMGRQGYETRLLAFKANLLWVSLLYFLSGIIWLVEREKKE
ncbi:MAG: nucleoside transporter [Planctomycetes bacterium]|nr:nucleoside transporter [Planctomycetota bacterium]